MTPSEQSNYLLVYDDDGGYVREALYKDGRKLVEGEPIDVDQLLDKLGIKHRWSYLYLPGHGFPEDETDLPSPDSFREIAQA